jgi:hypothetical protein
MGYALRVSLWLFKFVGSASQHKFIPDEFVFVRARKATRTTPGRSCYAYPEGGSGVSHNPPDAVGAIRSAIAPYVFRYTQAMVLGRVPPREVCRGIRLW